MQKKKCSEKVREQYQGRLDDFLKAQKYFNIEISFLRFLGYLLKSIFLLNCDGFTKMLTNVNLHFFLEIFIKDICPLCNPPIVGTKPRFLALSNSILRSMKFLNIFICVNQDYK